MLTLLLPTAAAFAPTGSTWSEPNRILRYHRDTQARLAQQPDWVEFLARDGRGWHVRFDEDTGTAHAAWGPPIALSAIADAPAAEAAVRNFLRRNAGLVGVPPGDLVLSNATWDARLATWFVDFDRLVDGVPVWRGGLSARIRNGGLVYLSVDTWPDVRTLGGAEITAVEARQIAQLDGPASLADHREISSRLVALPVDDSLVLTWEVRSSTASPLGRWVSFVHAGTGELLSTYNDIKFFTGVATGRIDTRTVDGNYSDAALPLLSLGDSFTGEDGSYDVLDGDYTVGLRGSYLTVYDDSGAEASLVWSGDDLYWTDDDATQAEIDSYKALHDVRAWSLAVAPDNDMAVEPLVSHVNSNETSCNAVYDGNVNFYEAANGCNNTGRIADVNYHEWGHGFHYYAMRTGSWDGSVGEGVGDAVSALLTGDSVIAPYFMTNGSAIRDVGPDRVYPDDLVGEVHEDGLIFAGAVYDLRAELSATYGEGATDRGTAFYVVSSLLAEALKLGPTLDEAYDAFVYADDDDDDVTNGTPHQCEILAAFGDHGLGPLGGSAGPASIMHQGLANPSAGAAVTVSATVANLAEGCVDIDTESAEVVYSVDGGSTWERIPLVVSGEDAEGEIPAQSEGTLLQYYIEVDTNYGASVGPAPGEWAPYTTFVGNLEEVWCEDFSAGDADFTHALIDGREKEGADDWIFGDPGGQATDPADSFTGRDVWGNDLGGGNYNGEYQPSIHNRLSSPAVETGAGEYVLQYRRWLGIEDGYYDRARVLVGEEILWENHDSGKERAAEATLDDSWVQHTVAFTTTEESLTFSWEIESDQGLEYGGWNVDDVCLYRVVPSSLVEDFSASDDIAGEVQLAWTQPAGQPEAIVIRREDRFGVSATDGEVVFIGHDLPAGAVTTLDAFVGEGWYSVFTGDGEDRTTGATEGRNADRGTGLAGEAAAAVDEPAIEVRNTGCGCASGGRPGAAALLAGLILLLHRRR